MPPNEHQHHNYLFINASNELLRLNIDRIIYLQSNGNYTDIHCPHQTKYTIRMSLLKMQTLLTLSLKHSTCSFVRIGKQLIINTAYITHISITRQRLLLGDQQSFETALTVNKHALSNLKNALTTTPTTRPNQPLQTIEETA